MLSWLQEEAGGDFEVNTPAVGPYCGCDTRTIREVLAGAWPVIEQYARAFADRDEETPDGGPDGPT